MRDEKVASRGIMGYTDCKPWMGKYQEKMIASHPRDKAAAASKPYFHVRPPAGGQAVKPVMARYRTF